MSREVVIVSACRTPIGSFAGSLSALSATKLGAIAVEESIKRAGIEKSQVDEVIMGCVLPANLGQAPARQASIAAGIPKSAGCTTINKVCGSGMKAIMFGHDLIKAGSANVVVAGGMGSMTNAPHMVAARTGLRYGDAKLVDHMAWDGLTNPYDGQSMGVFAEATADKYLMAHYLLTEGKDRRMYEAAKRLADCWCRNIGPSPKRAWYEGHEELEQALVRFMETAHPEIGRDIAEKKRITDDNTSLLKAAMEEFTATWS